MSRTFKGKKGAGFDYWSRRYGNASGSNCPDGKGNNNTKRITNRAERRIAKQKIREELSE